MSTTTKSIKQLLNVTYAVAKQALPQYSHRFSRKEFTLPQLFSCLVLRTYLKTDYRGVSEFLSDFEEVRDLLELQSAPHFTTIQKANERILSQVNVTGLFKEIFAQAELKKMKPSLTFPMQLSMELDSKAP